MSTFRAGIERPSLARVPSRFAMAVLALLLLPPGAWAQNDLHLLSDEFETSLTQGEWQRVHLTEQWNNEQLEVYDIDQSNPGRMTMVPYTVVWYQDWRGPMAFKEASGDFAITADVRSTGRDGSSVPASLFSLGGIMLRAPRDITPGTWTPGGEDYLFLSIGYGSGPTQFHYEDKTTDDSNSTLILSPAPGPRSTLQLARIGEYVIALRQAPSSAWQVHRRFHRADLPPVLQAGLVTYTDWAKCQPFDPFVHNQIVLDPPLPPGVTDPRPDIPYTPDLLTTFEYARFARVNLPPELEGVDLTNTTLVPDAVLLAFLGEHVNEPGIGPSAVEPAPRLPALELELERNPSWGSVEIVCSSHARETSLSLFDVSGRVVRAFSPLPAEARVLWDGTDAVGRALGSGIFFARLESNGESLTRRIVRLR